MSLNDYINKTAQKLIWAVFSCLPKTPGYAGEFKKSFSVPYNRKTPFDIIKLRSANCNEKYQKEDIRDEF
jgi:hypothetical protein